MADGSTHHVTPLNPDHVRWEMTAARRWPEMLPDADTGSGRISIRGIQLQQTFICGAAMKRTAQTSNEVEDCRDTECSAIEEVGDAEHVDPTRQEHDGLGSPMS